MAPPTPRSLASTTTLKGLEKSGRASTGGLVKASLTQSNAAWHAGVQEPGPQTTFAPIRAVRGAVFAA